MSLFSFRKSCSLLSSDGTLALTGPTCAIQGWNFFINLDIKEKHQKFVLDGLFKWTPMYVYDWSGCLMSAAFAGKDCYGVVHFAIFNNGVQANVELLPSNTTIGREVLQSRGLLFEDYFVWVSVGALFGFTMLSMIGYTLALTFLKAPGASASFISREKLSQLQRPGKPYLADNELESYQIKSDEKSKKGCMILPFQPLTVTFHHVHYYIDTPTEMREQGFTEKKLELLHDITGVLTALMGVSGAGKTTLLDVLAGRKTSGIIEGEIKIGGYRCKTHLLEYLAIVNRQIFILQTQP